MRVYKYRYRLDACVIKCDCMPSHVPVVVFCYRCMRRYAIVYALLAVVVCSSVCLSHAALFYSIQSIARRIELAFRIQALMSYVTVVNKIPMGLSMS